MRVLGTIRSQALLLGLVPLVFLLALLGLGVALEQASQQAAVVTARENRALNDSEDLQRRLTAVDNAAISLTQRRGSATDLSAAEHAFLTSVEALRADSASEPALAASGRRYAALSRALLPIVHRYVGLVLSSGTKAAAAYAASAHVRAAGARWTTARAQFDAAARRREIAAFARLHAAQSGDLAALIACAIVGILLSLVVAIRFGRRIVGRLARLAESAGRLASGEPAERIEGEDEIADLDRVYQGMFAAYQREHRVATTLQRALLPQQLPAIPGIHVETAYAPGSAGADVGGDWYDVFRLEDDHVIGIGVGDVAGHGLRAATTMGAVRQAIRIGARERTDPAQVLELVNRALWSGDDDYPLVTAFFAVLDVKTARLRYAVAGHPPPIVLEPEGPPSTLNIGGLMLGVSPSAVYTTHECTLRRGAALLLYTDGIVEVNREYTAGFERLAEIAQRQRRGGDFRIAERIQQEVFSGTPPFDDSALLVLSLLRQGVEYREFRWQFDARSQSEATRARRSLIETLETALPAIDRDACELIFAELVGNAARHTPGPVSVSLEAGAEPLLRVCDRGDAIERRESEAPAEPWEERGRGLYLVQALSRGVTIERRDGGNCISVLLAGETSAVAVAPTKDTPRR